MTILNVLVLLLPAIVGQAQGQSCDNFNASSYRFPDDVFVPPPFDRFVDKGVYTYLFGIGGQPSVEGNGINFAVGKSETPIAIRAFSYGESATWNCIAAYDSNKRDAFFPDRRPIISDIPANVCEESIHTTAARTQCMVYMYASALPTIFPGAVDGFKQSIASVSKSYENISIGIHPEVEECSSKPDYRSCVNAVARNYNYRPDVVGSAISLDMIKYALGDGWNMDGSDEGECEYNCRPYSDTSGYQPKNIPGQCRRRRGRKFKWQPLEETDGQGFFFRQEHVTPQIGTKATPRLLTRTEINAKKLKNPKYKYKEEADLVVARLKDLDDTKKMQVELFDSKSNVIALISRGLQGRYGISFSFERVILYTTIYTAAEYDAVVLSWKEKVRHDLVRTTTIIQEARCYGTPKEVTTYAGPNQGTQTFSSKYFQPYIRIMPHAEYPSGSGCICTSNLEATKAYMKVVFDDAGGGFFAERRYAAGDSFIEPGVTPAEDLTLRFTSLEQIRDVCGQSRLDGGMHFTASVLDSYELCQGFGPLVESYIMKLLNGSTDLLTKYVPS